jgi:hypothetical protein
MKLLLVSGFLIAGFSLFGQDQPLEFKVYPQLNDSVLNKLNFNIKGSPNPGSYNLPGGMPCIVPDTKGIAPIPNGWKGPVAIPYTPVNPRIPNPAVPLLRKVSYNTFRNPANDF